MKKAINEKPLSSNDKESVNRKKKEFKIEIVRVGKLEEKTAGSGKCECECVSCECRCVAPDGPSALD